ncbi:MAG: hypothetical protein ACOC53_08360 [Candidatus Saliniplasma sp.]
MKRKLDATGYTQYLAVIVIVLILAVGFVAFVVTSGSEGGGSTDDYNPITVKMYLDTSADLKVSWYDAKSVSIENADYKFETKRTNLELKNLGWGGWGFDKYNGEIKCSLYIEGELEASGSKDVKLEDSWSGWNVSPGSVDFSFGPIEAEEDASFELIYELTLYDTPYDSGDSVTLEGSV